MMKRVRQGGLLGVFALLFVPLAQAQYVEVSLPPSLCSGFIAKFSSTAQQAYLFTAGHCLRGVFERENPSKVVTRVPFEAPKKMVVYALGSKPPAVLSVTGVAFASARGADFAVLTLAESTLELERMGIVPLTAELSIESLHGPIEVLSAVVGERAECSFEARPFQVSYQHWSWNAMGRLSAACRLARGWSGAPVVSVQSGRVLGIVSGGNDDGTCADFCEVGRDGSKTALEGRAYFSELSALASCVSAQGQLMAELCESDRH